MGTFVDMMGFKTGMLEVIGLSERRGAAGQYYWICRCDCGSTTEAATSTLKQAAQKSCGCWKRGGSRKLASATFRENLRLSGRSDFDTAVGQMFTKYQSSTKDRNKDINFKLSLPEFTKLVTDNCFYCGTKPNRLNSIQRKYDKPTLRFSGIDRVDSDKDYTTDNCVTCCTFCNRAKNDLSLDDFLSWASRFAEHQGFVK